MQGLASQIPQSTVITDDRFLKAYADTKDYTAVIAILNARIARNPKDMQSQLSLASVYSTIGQKQKAIDIINQMIVEDPSFKTQGQGYIKQIQSQ